MDLICRKIQNSDDVDALSRDIIAIIISNVFIPMVFQSVNGSET